MHNNSPSALVVAGLLLFAASLAACSDDDGSLSSRVTGGTGGGGEVPDGRWAALLQLVPDTPETRGQVIMTDVVGATEAADIARPPATASSDDVVDYLIEVFSVSPERGAFLPPLSFMASAAQLDEAYRAELGYSLTQIDAAIETGLPPETYTGFLGSFDPDAVDQVLAEVPYWSDVQETVSYGGVEYYRWGEDGEADLEHISPARPIGFGGRMLVDDRAVMSTRSDAAMEAMIDARAGTASLADNEDFALMADALEDEAVFGALLTDDVLDAEGTDDVPVLEGVEAYAPAWGLGSTGTITSVLVLVSADEASAEANIDLFTERLANGQSEVTRAAYADYASVVSAETDGRVTIFHLETGQPRFFFDAMFRRDPVVANG